MSPETQQHIPFSVLNRGGRADLVIICDHASKVIPGEYNNLGLSDADLDRHIAWDIGAQGVAELLGAAFDAPAVICGTSRLVIDCNRHPTDSAAMPVKSDGVFIPGNRNLTQADRDDRVRRFFSPYHDMVEEVIQERVAEGHRPLILSVHSMTPEMNGKFRPWEISLSSNERRQVSELMLGFLRRRSDITVGDNQPYNLDPAEDYSTPVHALARQLPYLQVEFRQDQVGTPAGIKKWANIFAEALGDLLKQPQHFA
ncbi:MAG TPA: N-formylglutamate amidohydrolase [Terriglobales bacterium]|nr:N-formylglutamate amidohydrolase [Terriglobales bacterium]